MKLSVCKYPKESSLKPSENRLVFLHGMGGTGAMWRPIAASLETTYELLCPDQRGHGDSRVESIESELFTPQAFAADVAETMESEGFFPAWIFGHSMGARTTAGLAHLRPDLCHGIVLIDLGLSGEQGGGIGTILRSFLGSLPTDFADRNEAREYLTAHCPDASIAQYLLAVSRVNSETGRLYFPFQTEALMKTTVDALGTPTESWVREFAETTGKPVWILRGALSRVYAKDDFESEKSRLSNIPNIHFVEIEGAGHGLPFEKRLDFLKLIRERILA